MNDLLALLKEHEEKSCFFEYLDVVDLVQRELIDLLNRHYSEPTARLLALKAANILVARYEFRHRHRRLVSRPFGLIIDPVNHCNLHCPGCVHSRNEAVRRAAFDWPSGEMDEQAFEPFLHRFVPFAIQIAFYSNGEPFLSNHTTDYIRRARAYGVMTTTSSNLSHSRINAEAVVESGLDYLTLSIDGATADVYSMFRRGGDFDQVIENVRALVRARRKYRAAKPTLAWQFLVFKHNRHQRERVRQLAEELGVDLLIYAKPMSVAWDAPEIQDDETCDGYQVINLQDVCSSSRAGNIVRRFEKLARTFRKERSELDALAVNAENRVIEKLLKCSWRERGESVGEQNAGVMRKRSCEWLYKNMTVDAKGRIMPCCRAPAQLDHLVFGDIKDNDPFNTKEYQQARDYYACSDQSSFDRGASDALFCWRCPHPDQPALTGNHHIPVFFNRFDPQLVIPRELSAFLASWD